MACYGDSIFFFTKITTFQTLIIFILKEEEAESEGLITAPGLSDLAILVYYI
jgi:hypothetical protein